VSGFAHIECDLAAMAMSCWETFLSPEQEAILIEMLKRGEAADNSVFSREHEEEEYCNEY
jgi:hypothetical protein